ncbi:MAG: TonB-dependent receptor plug domain-containing protein [Alphaproteobacteria bacterium]|nr:TonB-dependent receptor plug domain-containing protein [Alphaproteobacteria bacterium]
MVKGLLLASSMLTGLSIASPASAQDTQPAAKKGGVDVIVVTAEKRAQSIQSVPLSIIAMDTKKLDQLVVADFNDYSKFLPSLSFQSTGPSAINLYMRGVASGGDGNHSASLPSVGVYLDEQPVTTILGFLPVHIYDIQRVEALAGPQGTLYGASSESGTLRIITNKPDTSKFEAGYDFEGNKVDHGGWGYQFEGFMNQPLSDRAAIRLVGYYEKDAGYIDNVLGSRTYPTSGITRTNANLVKKDFNDVETVGGRAALKIDLDDNWTMTPTVMGQQQIVHGVFAFDPKVGDLQVNRFNPDYSKDRWVQAALTLEGKIGNFDLTYAGAYLKRQIDSRYDYTDYAYYYDVLYGYGAYFYGNGGSTDYIDPTQYYVGEDGFTKYSNELRIQSPQGERVRFTAGLFMNHQVHDIQQDYKVDNLADILEVPGWTDTIWLTEQTRTDRDYAIFGQAEFDLTDKLTFVGGVRGYKYKNSLVGFFGYNDTVSSKTGVAACFGPAIVPGSPCTNLDKTVQNTGETHKLGLTYHVTGDKMLYFTYSTGFRPGGVNRRGTLPPYLEDKLINYEVGWKTQWADQLIFNATFFLEKWKDFQFPILGQNGLTEIKNANQARILGIEGNATWAPVDGLTFDGAFSITDAKLTANYCGFVNTTTGLPETNCPSPEAPDGTRLPVVPRFKGNLTARYEWPVGSAMAHIQGTVSGQSNSRSSLLVLDQSILGDQKGYVIADFTAGLKKGSWSLEAYLSNAFDKRADQFDFVACTITTCGQRAYTGTNRPRTIGVRFGQRF